MFFDPAETGLVADLMFPKTVSSVLGVCGMGGLRGVGPFFQPLHYVQGVGKGPNPRESVQHGDGQHFYGLATPRVDAWRQTIDDCGPITDNPPAIVDILTLRITVVLQNKIV